MAKLAVATPWDTAFWGKTIYNYTDTANVSCHKAHISTLLKSIYDFMRASQGNLKNIIQMRSLPQLNLW